MHHHKILAPVTLAVLTIMATPVDANASANASICRHLENQERELRQSASGAKRISLERDLRSAEQQVRRAGCSGLRLIFNGGKRQCRALRSRLDRLRNQLRRPSRATSSKRQLNRIEAAKRRHGCLDASARTARLNNKDGYRTVCVRSCDGYYFPIGFSTPRSKLERDAAVCESFYPEAKAALYFHSSSSGEAGEMVSLKGEKYAEQPFAFAYRSRYDSSCAGNLRIGYDNPRDGSGRGVEVDLSAQVPFPVPRPVIVSEAAISDDTNRRGARSDSANIRVVGPKSAYVVLLPEDDAVVPVASAPKRIASSESERSWLTQIASFLSVSAQADESSKE